APTGNSLTTPFLTVVDTMNPCWPSTTGDTSVTVSTAPATRTSNGRSAGSVVHGTVGTSTTNAVSVPVTNPSVATVESVKSARANMSVAEFPQVCPMS